MTWQARISTALGAELRSAVPVHGGDLSQVFRAELDDGRLVAVKPGRMAGVEARMLRAMRDGGAAAPDVLWFAEDLLCLTWLHETPSTPSGWRALGQTLRVLHDNEGPDYGWGEDYAFGAVAVDNRPCADWPSFWAERRLLALADHLPVPLARRTERLARDLSRRLPRTPAPSLLHGDLWTGNALFSAAQAWLIDPACYHGDREVDLAMLTLFGRPSPAFHEGYGDMEAAWEARQPIYQLWPALVHHALFGAGYRRLVADLLDQAGA